MMALLLPSLALAKPQVTLSIVAEKDIVVEENGQQVTKRVLAEEVAPGEIVIYTITYENSGDEAANNVTIVDPIPEGTTYIADSATKAGELDFLYRWRNELPGPDASDLRSDQPGRHQGEAGCFPGTIYPDSLDHPGHCRG